MNESFVFYESFYEGINELDPADQLTAYKAITEYALYGKEPEVTGIVKAIFALVKPQIDANNVRRNNGKKGGRPAKETNGFENEKPTVPKKTENKKPNVNVNVNGNVNVNANENVNGNGESEGKGKTLSRFAPPTLDEVIAYGKERQKDGHPVVNDVKFFNFYASKGWMVGKNKMKDWKAAYRSWEADAAPPPAKKKEPNAAEMNANVDKLLTMVRNKKGATA